MQPEAYTLSDGSREREVPLGSKPFFDRTVSGLVGEGDCMYVHNDFVRPGRHSYFIVVPNGSGGFKYKK